MTISTELLREGEQRLITADTVVGKRFRFWSGDNSYLSNPNSPRAIVTMPDHDITVKAEYYDNIAGIINTSSIVTGGLVRPLSIINYGLLYNWYAATDVRNIASIGWHVPSYSEWQALSSYLGGAGVAGGKLKETGTTYWSSPNTGATNEVGFNGRAGGERTYSQGGQFNSQGLVSTMWGSDDWGINGNDNVLRCDNDDLYHGQDQKERGHSIRLIKNSTSLTNGQTGIYVGNDGKIYRTICIGTQEWIADNLAETKYRNGDLIPEVTDGNTWVSLTTGALCAFNNDWNKV